MMLDNHGNNLIHKDKDRARTSQGNIGRFGFALIYKHRPPRGLMKAGGRTSHEQECIKIQSRRDADMFNAATATIAQEIETEAITGRVHLSQQPGAQRHPLNLGDLDLED
jgi:hypothetical protein